eukprot:CAMPEP_0116901444 /NCGR_PEP_ID=MMETSP0467-20121206/9349_1 /TAXON_ID=283647 /ORGANISM="Mesodinium pulex, Strain SPMC105" /LENGTH=54 /DNA_ID=CAMNT_0004574943 /DNA_START=1309 /DNA_END=1473 /DNA_ORIENTATION=+
MEVLDGDGALLRDKKGRVAKRDIVQFVKFSDYNNKDINLFNQDLLFELPGQIEE